MTLIPEYIFAMDSAIKTILMEKDEDDAFEGKTWIHEENVHHKTRFQYYCDEVSIWERNKAFGNTGANITEHRGLEDISFPTREITP